VKKYAGWVAHRVLQAIPQPHTLTTMLRGSEVLKQKFLWARCHLCHPTNSVKALKARSTFCSLKHSLHLDVIQRPTIFSQP